MKYYIFHLASKLRGNPLIFFQKLRSSGPGEGVKSCEGYILGVAPSQDASDHQDDITFLVGDPYKPSFPTVTGRGPYPSYIDEFRLFFWVDLNLFAKMGQGRLTPRFTYPFVWIFTKKKSLFFLNTTCFFLVRPWIQWKNGYCTHLLNVGSMIATM